MQVDLWDTQIWYYLVFTTTNFAVVYNKWTSSIYLERLDSNPQSTNCDLFVWAGTAGSFS